MQQNGFTIVELVIVIAIAGVLMAIGLPALKDVIDSTRSKSAAESILGGLRLAKAEAIRRNMPMRFQLVSSLDNNCVLKANSGLWVVNQDEDKAALRSPAGMCGAATKTPVDGVALDAWDVEPYIAYKSDGNRFVDPANPNPTLTVTAIDADGLDAALITFHPLGRVISNFDGSDSLMTVTIQPVNSDGTPNPNVKAWQVRVLGKSGSIKFCDPALAAGEPLAC